MQNSSCFHNSVWTRVSSLSQRTQKKCLNSRLNMIRSLATLSSSHSHLHWTEEKKRHTAPSDEAELCRGRKNQYHFRAVREWVSVEAERKEKVCVCRQGREGKSNRIVHFRCGNGRSLSINAYVLSRVVFPSIGWLDRMFDVNPANKQMRVVNINSTAAPSFCNQSILSCSDNNSELFSLTHRRVNGL